MPRPRTVVSPVRDNVGRVDSRSTLLSLQQSLWGIKQGIMPVPRHPNDRKSPLFRVYVHKCEGKCVYIVVLCTTVSVSIQLWTGVFSVYTYSLMYVSFTKHVCTYLRLRKYVYYVCKLTKSVQKSDGIITRGPTVSGGFITWSSFPSFLCNLYLSLISIRLVTPLTVVTHVCVKKGGEWVPSIKPTLFFLFFSVYTIS